MAKLGVADLFFVERELTKLGRETGFPVITLAPSLAEIASRNNQCLHGFQNAHACAGHWNAKGHAYASHLLAQGVCQALSAP